MNYPNIYALFRERAAQYRGQACFYVRESGNWRGINWEVWEEEAHALASALIAQGLERGAKVCVLLGNVPAWPVADIAIIAAGGVSVGLYPTSSAEQCAYIINHSDAEFVIVETVSQLAGLRTSGADLPKVKVYIVLDPQDENLTALNAPQVFSWDDFLALGRRQASRVAYELQGRATSATPENIAVMVYTSGTTGQPKGACLSHRYILQSVASLRAVIPIYAEDVAFSYLPYCHVAERISGLYNRLAAGTAAYFIPDITQLATYFAEVKPTVFASLPRFFEKIHARIMSDLERETPATQAEFYAALDIGREISQLRQRGQEVAPELAARFEREAGSVLQRVRDYFGGRIRLLTSGGAPLIVEIAEFFAAAGLPVLQAYGLTENICVAFNRPDKHKFGTVGPPMPGCEVRIAPDGEILVRSQMMFSGYYRAPAETSTMFQAGWLLTGDLGRLDDDGFLSITGRKKELIITSTGKNVAPTLVENMLKEHHLISQAMLYGDGRSYLVALLTLNQSEAESYAQAHGLSYKNFADLTRRPEIQSLIANIVAGVNARVSSTEAVRKYVVLEHDLSATRDELTPTLKLKRDVVARHYGALLEALYE